MGLPFLLAIVLDLLGSTWLAVLSVLFPLLLLQQQQYGLGESPVSVQNLQTLPSSGPRKA